MAASPAATTATRYHAATRAASPARAARFRWRSRRRRGSCSGSTTVAGRASEPRSCRYRLSASSWYSGILPNSRTINHSLLGCCPTVFIGIPPHPRPGLTIRSGRSVGGARRHEITVKSATGPLAPGAHVNLEVLAGDLEVELAPTIRAALRAEATTGDIDVDLPLQNPQKSRRRVEGILGSAGATIEPRVPSG